MHIQKTLLRSSPLDLWRLRYFHLFFLNGPQALGGGGEGRAIDVSFIAAHPTHTLMGCEFLH